LAPIDFSYTTSYRLSIVTFALGRALATIHVTDDRQTTDGRTQHCTNSVMLCYVTTLCYLWTDAGTGSGL